MTNPTASSAAVPLIRLVGTAVELVAEGADALAGDDTFVSAVRLAASALAGLDPHGESGGVEGTLLDLSALVASLPDPWA